MQVRCKMKCKSKLIEGSAEYPVVTYTFTAVCADEVPENQRYHKYTPDGSICIKCTNPNVSYEVGVDYYFDSTPCKLMESLGIKVDVWIDDHPEMIVGDRNWTPSPEDLAEHGLTEYVITKAGHS